jgi:hypothetical protein
MRKHVAGCWLLVRGAVSSIRGVSQRGTTNQRPATSNSLWMLFASLLVAVTLLAQNHTTATDARTGVGSTLSSLGNASGWYAWKVPIGTHSVWCNRCTLEGDSGFSINGDQDDDGPAVRGEMLMALRIDEGKVRKVRLFNPSCEIETRGKTLHMLTNVPVESSVDYLLAQIRNADREGELMAALSLHEHPRVVPALIQLARHDPETEIRRHAIFWLGQKAGSKVAGELRRAVDEDPDDDVKKHAVFAISQLPRDRSVPLLIDLVKTHKNRSVRERSMFWLAQTGDPRAIDLIESILMP